ncbi:MAG: hypothetical protein IPH12_10485 [Saprospirales bacterium]|nr:hypothetical protein [Saprospirales bacterium]MBK8922239.1 hypothetical protein [Saprospirales bacterium]
MLLIFSGLLLLMAANPLNQTIYHGIFGILLHLGFLLFGFHYLENRQLYCWDRLMGLLMLVFAVEVILGMVQYNLPRNHFINRYAAEGATSIAYVGERARVTGTFSYVAGFTSWLFFTNIWIWSLALRRKSIQVITILTALAILASLISGARAALGFTFLFAVFLYYTVLGRISPPRIILVILTGALIGISAFQNSPFVREAWDNFYSRIEDGIRDQEFGRRTFGVLEEVINYRGDYPILGSGLGGTYQGARSLWGESYILKRYGGYEEEPERIVLEGGLVLFFLRTILLIYMLAALRIPKVYKFLFGIIILFFTHSIFNVYNIVFVPLALSLLDWAFRNSGKSST